MKINKRVVYFFLVVVLLIVIIFSFLSIMLSLGISQEIKRNVTPAYGPSPHPRPGPTTKPVIVYEVKRGDSIWGISNKFTVLEWQLRGENDLSKKSIIHPGDKLIIPQPKWKTYEGCASWYGPGFHGKPMANGEIYDQDKILVAHRVYPLGLKLRITNLEPGVNYGKSEIAAVLDRGPYKDDPDCPREIDASRGLARALGIIDIGVAQVRIEPLT